MSEGPLEKGFLEPFRDLTTDDIGAAIEAAFANAEDLLGDAEVLRREGRCARAYFLAQIASEELGKLPLLGATAAGLALGFRTDWHRLDRRLRNHADKTAHALYMDAFVGETSARAGGAAYDADLKRMPGYLDMKNASLYSVRIAGRFTRPADLLSCEFVDEYLRLVRGRMSAFHQLHVAPMEWAGGIAGMLAPDRVEAVRNLLRAMTGPEGRAAYDEYEASGDERVLDRFFAEALGFSEAELEVLRRPQPASGVERPLSGEPGELLEPQEVAADHKPAAGPDLSL